MRRLYICETDKLNASTPENIKNVLRSEVEVVYLNFKVDTFKQDVVDLINNENFFISDRKVFVVKDSRCAEVDAWDILGEDALKVSMLKESFSVPDELVLVSYIALGVHWHYLFNATEEFTTTMFMQHHIDSDGALHAVGDEVTEYAWHENVNSKNASYISSKKLLRFEPGVHMTSIAKGYVDKVRELYGIGS